MTSKQADQSIVVPEWFKYVSPILWPKTSVDSSSSKETIGEDEEIRWQEGRSVHVEKRVSGNGTQRALDQIDCAQINR
jgi:hypothetical protein